MAKDRLGREESRRIVWKAERKDRQRQRNVARRTQLTVAVIFQLSGTENPPEN